MNAVSSENFHANSISKKTLNSFDSTSRSGNGPSYHGNIIPYEELNFDTHYPMIVRTTLDFQYFVIGLSNGIIKFYPVHSDLPRLAFSLVCQSENYACTDLNMIPFAEYYPSEKKHLLAAVYASGHVRLWHYTAATPKSRLLATIFELKQLRPDEQLFNASSILSASDNLNSARTGDAAYEEESHPDSPANQILACSASADGTHFITGGDDATIRVYEFASVGAGGVASTAVRRRQNRDERVKFEHSELIGGSGLIQSSACMSSNSSHKMDGHTMRICALEYHPRGVASAQWAHIFVSAGWDNSMHIWDDRCRQSLWLYSGPHICGSDALQIDADQNHIVSTSWERSAQMIQVWRFNEEAVVQFWEAGHQQSNHPPPNVSANQMAARYGRPIATVNEQQDTSTMGYVAQWLGSSHIVYAGCRANLLRIIDRATLNTIASVSDLPNGVYSVVSTLPHITGAKSNELQPLSAESLSSPLSTAQNGKGGSKGGHFVRLAFCAGNSLYLCKIDRKH